MATSNAALLDRFAAHAAAIRKQSPLDPRAVPSLLLGGGLLAAELAYILATDLTVAFATAVQIFGVVGLALAGGLLARRYGLNKIGDMLVAVALPVTLGLLTSVLTVILARHSAPFADDMFDAADRWLELDWLALLGLFQRNPLLVDWGSRAYSSFYWQFLALCVVPFVTGRQALGWRFVNAWAIALILCVVAYPWLTARGPYLYYGIVPADLPNLHRTFPWTTGPLIEAIRSHRNLDAMGSMGGLVWFPSFHACSAILYMWVWRDFRWLRWPMALLNAGLIAATPIIGFHYFIDVIGGIAVAFAAIWLANRLVGRIEQRSGSVAES